jgi:polyferredoxin
MGYGESLVRYSSENRDEGKARHWLRPRLAGYSTLIVALLALMTVFVASRIPLDVDVIRDRNRLYRESWDGSVENVYSLRISNREDTSRRYSIGVEGALPVEFEGDRSVEIPPGEMRLVPVALRLPATAGTDAAADSVEFVVRADHDSEIVVRTESPFHRPPRTGTGADG